jgi:hypothetical protein
MTAYIPVRRYQRFRRISCLHHHGQNETSCFSEFFGLIYNSAITRYHNPKDRKIIDTAIEVPNV